MDGSPSSVITIGFGTGTFAPVVGLVVTLGFGFGEEAATITGQWSNVLHIYSSNARMEITSHNERLEI